MRYQAALYPEDAAFRREAPAIIAAL
ncbi:hypothetical protein XACLE20_980066 [Xanthomonas citri pv. citri]|nr:hypothetical protein XAC902_620064 [Xanthomonas citri pv. citri]CEE71920.1 hypothetical protein XACS584_800041 [Xanthomonas citri pv. citri]CEE88407.1 hypothetical protein XACLE20_980066 [Xanthomonas citri pv. citri]CEF24995.1 hypothetical protein XACJK2_860024 [Xanthomonas citri pv. citri]CEH44635.1 hypothetical protein XACLE3_4670012 [Xanthomonas citri pv. citri]